MSKRCNDWRGEGFSFEMKGLETMSRGLRTLLLTSVLAGMSVAPAMAQIAPMGSVPKSAPAPAQVRRKPPPAAKAAPDALTPTSPDFKADQPGTAQAVPVPPPLPPAVWDVINAQELLQYIAAVGKEGLNPAD